ncbi:Txe/YoeB family addiction module toxin [Nostoc sp. FACHB-280]|uniref:Txe/YoeB family addiction module toxin n=1 Tax=Nostoc sp. FACHB-280 TaxID=2692839 RepID=UPI001F55285B|nr:Txe/YoeB family addiction module toxin [Nostoc sp. FACHB-280]
MYRQKHLLLPESTLQASDRATESTIQAPARAYLKTREVIMKIYSLDGQHSTPYNDQLENNLRASVFHPQFKEDLQYWEKVSPKKLNRIRQLIKAIILDPFKGKGNPKPLKYQGSNVWSREIDKKHRLVYLVGAEQIDFLQARFHYDDK